MPLLALFNETQACSKNFRNDCGATAARCSYETTTIWLFVKFGCVCVCVRYQTPFSSRHESGQSLFLSTGKHQAVGRLIRVSCSAQPEQRSDRPNLSPPQKTLIFQFPFASNRAMPAEKCSSLGKWRIYRSTSKRSAIYRRPTAVPGVD